jgi:DNA-directed RNA polymerase subunit RPC12/RpoP
LRKSKIRETDMDIGLFDNFEDDGQLSLFGFDEQYPDEKEELTPGIRIKRCTSCGKLLAVKEEAEGFSASCNNCGIRYFQRI